MNRIELAPEPNSAVLDAMVDRVEGQLLGSLGRNRKRRRRLAVGTVVAAGALMFGAGFSVAAVAIPRHTDPQFGVKVTLPNGDVVPDSLTIGCFTSTSAARPWETWAYGDVKESATAARAESIARHDPASHCAPAPTATAVSRAIAAEAANLQAAGAKCGSISVNGNPTLGWSVTAGPGGTTSTDFTSTAPAGSGCGSLVQLTVPTGPPVPSATCAVAANSAAVYPLDGKTAADVCDLVGESVWQG